MAKLYGVQTNTCLDDGTGRNIPVAFFASEDVAKSVENDPRYYRKYGIMGCPSNFGLTVYHVFNTADEFFEHETQVLREKALAKLTKADKELLNLK